MTEGRWTSLRDPQGKKFLQDLVFFLLAAAHKRVPKPVPLTDFGTGLPPARQRAEAAKGQGFVGQTSEDVIHSVKADRLTFRLKFCDVGLALRQLNSYNVPLAESVSGSQAEFPCWV